MFCQLKVWSWPRLFRRSSNFTSAFVWSGLLISYQLCQDVAFLKPPCYASDQFGTSFDQSPGRILMVLSLMLTLLGTNISPTSRYFWVDEFPFLHVSSLDGIHWMNLNVITRLPLIKVLAAFVQNNSYEYHKIHYFQQRTAEVMASKTSTGSSGIGTSCHKKVFCPSMELGFLWWPLSFIYLFVFFWGGVCTITLQVLIFKPWRVLNVFVCSWKAALWMSLFEVVHLKYALYWTNTVYI